MKIWKAAVIGLGQIGMGYDYDCEDGTKVLTHASAFHHHSLFELVAGVDPDEQKRLLFTRKFGAPAFATVQDMYLLLTVEVVALAVPTYAHFEAFRQILPHRPTLLICEKPISYSMPEAEAVVEEAKKNGIDLVVNYIRRFDPGVVKLKELISSGSLGRIYKGVAWYGKGIAHNGSHFINLLEFILGDVTGMRIINSGREVHGGDREPDVVICFGEAEIFFLAGRDENFSIASVELIGTAGRVLYTSSGEKIEYWKCDPDPTYAGYTTLASAPKIIENDMIRYQWNVLESLFKYLAGKNQELVSDGKSALKTLNVINKIKMLIDI